MKKECGGRRKQFASWAPAQCSLRADICGRMKAEHWNCGRPVSFRNRQRLRAKQSMCLITKARSLYFAANGLTAECYAAQAACCPRQLRPVWQMDGLLKIQSSRQSVLLLSRLAAAV